MQQILGNLMTCGRQVTKNSTIDGGTRWRGRGGTEGGRGVVSTKFPFLIICTNLHNEFNICYGKNTYFIIIENNSLLIKKK